MINCSTKTAEPIKVGLTRTLITKGYMLERNGDDGAFGIKAPADYAEHQLDIYRPNLKRAQMSFLRKLFTDEHDCLGSMYVGAHRWIFRTQECTTKEAQNFCDELYREFKIPITIQSRFGENMSDALRQ